MQLNWKINYKEEIGKGVTDLVIGIPGLSDEALNEGVYDDLFIEKGVVLTKYLRDFHVSCLVSSMGQDQRIIQIKKHCLDAFFGFCAFPI